MYINVNVNKCERGSTEKSTWNRKKKKKRWTDAWERCEREKVLFRCRDRQLDRRIEKKEREPKENHITANFIWVTPTCVHVYSLENCIRTSKGSLTLLLLECAQYYVCTRTYALYAKISFVYAMHKQTHSNTAIIIKCKIAAATTTIRNKEQLTKKNSAGISYNSSMEFFLIVCFCFCFVKEEIAKIKKTKANNDNKQSTYIHINIFTCIQMDSISVARKSKIWSDWINSSKRDSSIRVGYEQCSFVCS